jgi:TldD protein
MDAAGRLVSDRRMALRITARTRIGDTVGTAHLGGGRVMELLAPEEARELARRSVQAANIARDAGTATPGPAAVVIAAGSGGILLHEACGHLLEADYVRRGLSPYSGKLGRSVASPLVTAVDDPTLPGLPASQRIDDEGTIVRRKVLLHRGVLAGFLCGLYEAVDGEPGFTPGNARRRSFRHAPLPRMSNTMILPGEATPAEIIAATRDGIYAARLAAGRADPASGRFRFIVAEARRIENGSLTRPLAPLVISGIGPDALAAVDLVGSDARMDPTAAGCTKAGQTIPVSVGHPTLRIASLVVEPLGRDGR